MNNELSNQLQEAKEVLQATDEIPTSKFLTCEEYNTIFLKIVTSSEYDYLNNKEKYDALLSKLYSITIIEVEKLITLQEIRINQQKRIEAVSKPLTDKPLINNS